MLKKIRPIEDFKILELEREGIYLLYDKGNLIYIGESENLIRRIFCNHRNGNEKNSTLIRRLLRGDLGQKFKDVVEVKNFIKNLKIKILIDDFLKDKKERKDFEKKLKKYFCPKL